MEQEDRDRLIKIETILEKSIEPQLASFGPRIRKLEKVAAIAGVVWVGACGLGLVMKDVAVAWLKKKVEGHG